MAFQKYIFYLIFIICPIGLFSQKFGFNKLMEESPLLKMPFSVENNEINYRFLMSNDVTIKNKTENYIFFTETPSWVLEQFEKGNITNFFFEYTPKTVLDDTAREWHHVNPVHQGLSPLLEGYTGKDVILGIVDSGLDYDHPDFIDAIGRKRVIRYWNQNVIEPTVSPQPYNYGEIWSEDFIQNNPNTVTSNGNLGHGTTVTGMAGGNGLANGRNKGMAPEADIVFVETNFSLPNWTLTVADACDFIFRVADSLNKPAVINLSVGSLLGSRDGTDPASELMEQLIESKPGRIIVGAAGNSGNEEPFHATANMSIGDTSFIWFENNPDGALGQDFAFFDLWSDVNNAQFYYSFGANNNITYENVASTDYRFVQLNVGTTIFDTLYNQNGDRIATIEIHSEYENDNYHMQGFFSKVDSTDYLMRFSTTGIGKYDLWSGLNINLSKIVSDVPSSTQYPAIVNYVLPDSTQSVVSSWNCSPKIISVGNVKNRSGYVDYNGDMYYPSDMVTPGKIALTSSRGPNRKGYIKPDISATGETSLGSAPLYIVNNPSAYATTLDEGGYHGRNGGTSMASPIVAGIAALYLERCPKSTAAEFKEDLLATAYTDDYTGNVPNNRYGAGKVNAFDLLVSRNGNLQILGDTAICQMPVALTTNIELESYNWSNGSHNSQVIISQPETVSLYGVDMQGCKIYSDTVNVVQGSPLPNPVITIIGDSLVSSEAPNYQWYYNDHPISGATQQSYTPTDYGYYSVAVQGDDNCKSFSNAISWTSGLDEDVYSEQFKVYPNPAYNILNIDSQNQPIVAVELYSVTGKKLYKEQNIYSTEIQINISNLSSGSYFVRIITSEKSSVMQFLKN